MNSPAQGRDLFRFQLAFAKEQTEDVLSNLGNLVENTRNKALSRTKNFCLHRAKNSKLPVDREEDKWERAMYKKWGPNNHPSEFIPICKRAAMRRALKLMSGFELDVRLVSYGTPSRAILQMAEDFG